MKKAVEGFPSKKGLTETKFRDALAVHLRNALEVLPKREAGLAGHGTKIDLVFDYKSVDYVISIKKGLSEQKAKILIGEAAICAATWQHRAGEKTYFLVVVFGEKDSAKEAEYMRPLAVGLNVVEKYSENFRTDLVWCESE